MRAVGRRWSIGVASALLLGCGLAGAAETAAPEPAPAAVTGATVPTGAPSGPDAPECRWTGSRILSLLWRDDIRTAGDFLNLYDRFECPSEHIAVAFRCLIRIGVQADQGEQGLPGRATACWADPGLDPASLPPATPATEGQEGQSGEAPQQGQPNNAQPASP
jgi:hypothetical protein